MSLKYYIGAIIAVPLLPILYFQGQKIRKNVPNLPEAKNPKGYIKTASEKTLKLLVIGESTIAGVGVDFHKNGFTGALAKEISQKTNQSILWKVYAKSGYTAKMVRKRLIPTIEDSTADIIVIGLGGNSGQSSGSHLHFEVRYKGKPLNPKHLISFKNNKLLSDSLLLTKQKWNYSVLPLGLEYHTIKSGDFMYKIANRYGISVSKLCEINGISRNKTLIVGRKLRIR